MLIPNFQNLAKKIETLITEEYNANNDPDEFPWEMRMEIKLTTDNSICFRPRRLAFSEKEKLREILEELQKNKIIRPSNSPFASLTVLVKKKTGDIRLCVDYQELYKVTVKDNFSSPLINDHLDRLREKKYFSKLDLRNEFHHVQMAEESIKYTSLVTSMEQYEYLKMPFGSTNAPRFFQMYLSRIFQKLLKENRMLMYLHDLLIATQTVEEYLEILREVFYLFRRHKFNKFDGINVRFYTQESRTWFI